jgi:hypothetical protein
MNIIYFKFFFLHDFKTNYNQLVDFLQKNFYFPNKKFIGILH